MNVLSPLPTSLHLPFHLSSDHVFVWVKHSKVAIEIRSSFSETNKEHLVSPSRSLHMDSTQDLSSDEPERPF